MKQQRILQELLVSREIEEKRIKFLDELIDELDRLFLTEDNILLLISQLTDLELPPTTSKDYKEIYSALQEQLRESEIEIALESWEAGFDYAMKLLGNKEVFNIRVSK